MTVADATPATKPPFMTVTEVAGLLRVAPSTMWLLIGRGEIGSVKIGRARRIPSSEIDRLMREGGVL